MKEVRAEAFRHHVSYFFLVFAELFFKVMFLLYFGGAARYIRLILFSTRGKELRAAQAGLTSAVNVFVIFPFLVFLKGPILCKIHFTNAS